MNAEQERLLHDWLAMRDPGAAPARLRVAVAAVPQVQRGSLLHALDELNARFRWASSATRFIVIALLVLAVAVAIGVAALLNPAPPFPPPGLIAYPLGEIGGIHLMAADGSAERALTKGGHEKSPRWSPDGRSLLFIRFEDKPGGGECAQETSIVMHDLASGTERVLATEPIVVEAEWSPRGDRIAFFGLGGGVGTIGNCEMVGSGVIDLASGDVTRSNAGTGAFAFFWTGNDLLFLYREHLGRVDAGAIGNGQASEERFFTFADGQVAVPSPDGRYVSLSSTAPAGEPWSVEIVEVTSGARVSLGRAFFGWWSPDGTAVAFVQPGTKDVVEGLSRDHLVVAAGPEWRPRTLADVMVLGSSPLDPIAGIPTLAWTSDGEAVYWGDATGAHAVGLSSGRSIDLPTGLRPTRELQWQPQPTE